MKALNEGKTKIPRCKLLILGKEEVGKTSLYRQLVGKEFKENMDSTRGIDDNIVETVDRRSVDTEKWQEKEDPGSGEHFTKTLGAMVKPHLPDKKSGDSEDVKVILVEELLVLIQGTVRDIEEIKAKEAAPSLSPPARPAPRPGPVLSQASAPVTPHDPQTTPPASMLPAHPPPKKLHIQENPAPAPPPPECRGQVTTAFFSTSHSNTPT